MSNICFVYIHLALKGVSGNKILYKHQFMRVPCICSAGNATVFTTCTASETDIQ